MVDIGGLNIPARILPNRPVSKTVADRQLPKRDPRNPENRKNLRLPLMMGSERMKMMQSSMNMPEVLV